MAAATEHLAADYVIVGAGAMGIRFTIQPGAVFPSHTHPGTVLISVTEGDFVFMFAEDCERRDYSAGTALVDPDDTVHTAWNPNRFREHDL